MTHDKRKLFLSLQFHYGQPAWSFSSGLRNLDTFNVICTNLQKILPKPADSSRKYPDFRFDVTISALAARSHGKSGLRGFHETKGSVPSSGPDTAVIFIHTLLSPWRPAQLPVSSFNNLLETLVGNYLDEWLYVEVYHLGKLYALAVLRVNYNLTILNHTQFPHVTACETTNSQVFGGHESTKRSTVTPQEEAGIPRSFHPQSNRKYGIKME